MQKKMSEEQSIGLLNESIAAEKSATVTSYVQQVRQGVSAETIERIREEVRQKKRQDKLRELRKKKKVLTIFTPFELRTAKRIRTEIGLNGGPDQQSSEYEPLWL